MSVAEKSPMTMKAENGEQVFPMQIVKPVKIPKMWVRLNVGGRIFQTTRQTLMRESESFLARICQEDGDLPSETDETGAYLIDRDSDYFSTVLNYLRHGKIVIDRGLSLEGVLEEAEFYNLPRLIHLCNEKILEREKKTAALSKHVYRVLQCHEDELTNVISAMSDDWKFEQLIPIGTYSNDMQSEYLCVVSRECQDTQSATSPVEPSDRAKINSALSDLGFAPIGEHNLRFDYTPFNMLLRDFNPEFFDHNGFQYRTVGKTVRLETRRNSPDHHTVAHNATVRVVDSYTFSVAFWEKVGILFRKHLFPKGVEVNHGPSLVRSTVEQTTFNRILTFHAAPIRSGIAVAPPRAQVVITEVPDVEHEMGDEGSGADAELLLSAVEGDRSVNSTKISENATLCNDC
ncbi:hypothetical protein QR680_002179 [Steinernema hermaphroditum]|uniref:BTB domain-containing protein n=1 Tax=Steinernema hermaphroditum TaxID=289476 RepID=A0AA39LHQ2_9BILA|nr:hypothetical protein QR680_002179 [Steinernema hermaphroditum]